mmetsp:Transcript_110741/g.352788  ORF Transcript_110741/g.352788 Transcript_110741/m.352788 type:complete len:285 (-) Transcript_110741:730-1584(-)
MAMRTLPPRAGTSSSLGSCRGMSSDQGFASWQDFGSSASSGPSPRPSAYPTCRTRCCRPRCRSPRRKGLRAPRAAGPRVTRNPRSCLRAAKSVRHGRPSASSRGACLRTRRGITSPSRTSSTSTLRPWRSRRLLTTPRPPIDSPTSGRPRIVRLWRARRTGMLPCSASPRAAILRSRSPAARSWSSTPAGTESRHAGSPLARRRALTPPAPPPPTPRMARPRPMPTTRTTFGRCQANGCATWATEENVRRSSLSSWTQTAPLLTAWTRRIRASSWAPTMAAWCS